MPTILTKKSDTPGSIPATANLTNAAGGAELAVNTADKRLFTINSSSQVVELGTNPSSITCADGSFTVARIGSGTVTQLTSTSATITTLTATSATVTNLTATSLVISNLSVASMNITTLTSASATITNLVNTSASITTLTNNPTFGAGTANGVLYLNGSKVATSGSALTFDGTTVGTTGAEAIRMKNDAAFISGYNSANTVRSGYLQFNATDVSVLATSINQPLAFFINAAEQMRLTSTGLGIGTSSPAYKLDLTSSNDGYARQWISAVSFISSADGTNGFQLRNLGAGTQGIRFANYANTTEWMRLDTSGNLGIGTSSPAYTLDVSSNGRVRQSAATGTNSALWQSSNTGGSMYLGLEDSTGSLFTTTGYAGVVWHAGNYPIAFGTNNTERMRITASGNLGIGTSSPGTTLDITSANTNAFNINGTSANGTAIRLQNSGSAVLYVGSEKYITGASTSNYGIGVATANSLILATNGSTRATIDSSGNLGLGVTPSAWSGVTAFQIGAQGSITSTGNLMQMRSNAYFDGSVDKYIASSTASDYYQNTGAHIWRTAASGTAGNTISFTQVMTLDASGNLGVGGTAPGGFRLYTAGGRVNFNSSDQYCIRIGNNGTYGAYIGSTGEDVLNFFDSVGNERARITSGGIFGVGVTNPTGAVANAVGAQMLSGGQILSIVSADAGLYVNRRTSDGTLIRFYQDDTEEGNISVSGNTVSYNAFAGSHWSQLQDGSKPDILRGTVMESINELCVWPDETNERLPKSKISDTTGSKKVYGVFMAWDNDWTETNDMLVTSVGAFICRVNSAVTVQEGDLLESNGDGTARVQADDIIRSSTIGKVTSTVKTHEYDDGSYCVPTVLYCG